VSLCPSVTRYERLLQSGFFKFYMGEYLLKVVRQFQFSAIWIYNKFHPNQPHKMTFYVSQTVNHILVKLDMTDLCVT
jgi:hypothetical protein